MKATWRPPLQASFATRFSTVPAETPSMSAMIWFCAGARSEEHTSELQSHVNLVCRLLLEKKKKKIYTLLLCLLPSNILKELSNFHYIFITSCSFIIHAKFSHSYLNTQFRPFHIRTTIIIN